jgi:protein involved in polysaccharide export with SLBB domain
MALRNTTLIIAGLLLLQPAFIAAQEQRPALVPLSQGSGAGASSAASAASAGSIGGLSDGPISPGEVVHINVFEAPEFSLVTRVSDSGDVPYPILGSFHIGGLNSIAAASTLAKQLKDRNLMVDPEVTVTVDSSSTGITILGEVHSPGIYPPPGKHELSDLIATAGGLTANTGRLIEITNDRNPGKKEFISWDPTTSGARCKPRERDLLNPTRWKGRATSFGGSTRCRKRSACRCRAMRERDFSATSISRLRRVTLRAPSVSRTKRSLYRRLIRRRRSRFVFPGNDLFVTPRCLKSPIDARAFQHLRQVFQNKSSAQATPLEHNSPRQFQAPRPCSLRRLQRRNRPEPRRIHLHVRRLVVPVVEHIRSFRAQLELRLLPQRHALH